MSQYNIAVESTINPREGINKILSDKYDIVFLNHNMKDMSGEEFVIKLESTGKKIPVIVGLVVKTDYFENEKLYSSLLMCPIEFKNLNNIIRKYFSDEI